MTRAIPGAKKWRRGERGQAVVEFALTVPILLALLLGLIEMGAALNDYITIISSARDAARLGAQTSACGSNANQANCYNALQPLVTTETAHLRTDVPIASDCPAGAGICVTLGSLTSNGSVDKTVKVKVCYDHPFLIGSNPFVPSPLRMCSTTTTRAIS